MAEVQLADIVAPVAPPPAPPPYGAIALGAGLMLVVALIAARFLWRRKRQRRAALALLKQAERALRQQTIEPRAAAFQAAQALRHAAGKIKGATPEWTAFLHLLDQARYAPQPPSAQDTTHLIAQARRWISAC
jgi:hypothetical protein